MTYTGFKNGVLPIDASSDIVISKEFMRRLQLFEGLAEQDLEQLYAMSSTITLAEGEYLMREGDAGEELYIIMDGDLEISKHRGAQEQVLARRGPGEVVGEMAILEQAPRFASVRALRDSHLLVINQLAFRTLLSRSATAALTILQTVVTRLRNSEAMLMQEQKLSALGTMAAGLAHELNNPAAAIQRSTARLAEALNDWEGAAAELAKLTLDDEQSQVLAKLRESLLQQAQEQLRLDPLRCSEQEDDLQEWLEELGIGSLWQSVPSLVVAGWSQERLSPFVRAFQESQVSTVMRWVAAGASLFGLLSETNSSAKAITAIIKAVKSYTYLDEAPVQEVNVHKSLETTLTVLRHKLSGSINVVREYAVDLPCVVAFGSQLNQVWTNIVENALEAMQDEGELKLRTYAREQDVVVEIQDNGPGIPKEVQSHLFEPFFTTKPVGAGAGLGLFIAYNIVVHQHHGQLRAVSKPGFTCIQVTLPQRP